MAFENFSKQFGDPTKKEDNAPAFSNFQKAFGSSEVKFAEPPAPVAPVVAPAPAPKGNGFLDTLNKIGNKIESTTYNLSQYDKAPDYKPNLLKDTLKEIGSLEHLPLGIGDIISQARKDPLTVAALTPKDVFSGALETAKGFIKYPGDVALTLAGAMLHPILKNGAIKFDIPGLGEISNMQSRAIDRVNNGEPPWLVATTAVPEAIFDTLFVLGMAQKLTNPRPVTLKPDGVNITSMMNEKGVVAPKAKSFRSFEEPSYVQPVPPGGFEKMAQQKGFQIPPDYNPALPTYFRMTGDAGGVIRGSVIQLKPSYMSIFLEKLKGDFSKVPDNQIVPLFSQETSLQAIANAKPANIPTVPVVIPKAAGMPPIKPMPSVGILETLKAAEQHPQAVVTTTPEAGKVVQTPGPAGVEVAPEIQQMIDNGVAPAVADKAITDWQTNHADEFGALSQQLSQAETQLKTATGALKTELQKSVDSLTQQMTAIEENFVAKYTSSDIPKIQNEIANVYKSKGPSSVGPEFTKAQEELSNISTELQLSTPGEKIFAQDGSGFVKSVPSTFPDYIPENLRRADLFKKLAINLDSLSYPKGSRQAALYDAVLNELDSRLGVDTSVIREQLKNNENKISRGNAKASSGSVARSKRSAGVAKPKSKGIKTPSGSAMAKYNPKDLPKLSKEFGGLNQIKPVQMPELVRLTRDLMGKFPEVVKKTGDAAGRFYHDGRIKLIASLFDKEATDANQAGRVLAHEIGHLIDWLPNQDLKRGNLLGRLRSLQGFFASTFSDTTGAALDLKALKNEAVKEVLSEKKVAFGNYIKDKAVQEQLNPEIDQRYQQKIDASGAIKNPVVKKELLAVTRYWHPYDPKKVPAAYKKYRESSKELYADALSVMFNDPATLEKMAPTFYKEFFNGLDTKPEVKRAFFELQQMLDGTPEEIYKARMDDVLAGFARAEAIQADFRAKKELSDRSLWEKFRQQVDDINYPILKKQAQAEAAGKVFTEEENPKFILQEATMADNENFTLVDKINTEIAQPIREAGMTLEDIGQYLLLDRIRTGRAEIANPYGFTPDNATEQLKHLESLVGQDNFKMLQEKVKLFHDTIFPSVEEAVRVGSYNKETFDTTIKPNKDNYAAFQVVDYMQENMPAGIKAQVGTLKEVANPFTSTILKTVALNRLNAYQRAKNVTIKMLRDQFPAEISETRRITTDGKLSIFKPAQDKGSIEVLEDGKMQSYDVDPYIAESFKINKVGDLNVIVEIADKFNNKFFKPVVTTYSLGFAIGTNPIRDFKRNYKLIPNATIANLLTEYAKALPEAFKYAGGQLDEFTKTLVDSKAISTPMSEYGYDAVDTQFGAILEKYGIIKPGEKTFDNKTIEAVRKTLVVPVVKILNGIKYLADSFEMVSKIAGAKVRMAGGESGKELAFNVRNFTGTPNFRTKGSQTRTTNALFVFSNILKEGIKTDIQIATNPNSRSGYWWKTVKIDLMPKFLMALAAAGILGKELKDMMDKATEYDKTNYIVIPLGETADGKAVYFRMPHDETGRLVSAVFWKLASALSDGGNAKDIQQIFALGAGQFPSLTPGFDVIQAWAQYASGKNPYDAFRGRTVIDDTTWAAGGGAALKKMVMWTISDLGLAKISTYDDATKTGLETAMEIVPWFSSMIKISDYGIQEKYKQVGADQKQKEAQMTLKQKELISTYAKMYREDPTKVADYSRALVTETLGHAPQSAEDLAVAKTVLTKYAKSLIAGSQTDPREKVLQGATSNEQKVKILEAMRADMPSEDFRSLIQSLAEDKSINEDILKSLLQDGPISQGPSKILSMVNKVLGVRTAQAAEMVPGEQSVSVKNLKFSENGIPYFWVEKKVTPITDVKVTPAKVAPMSKLIMKDPRKGFSRTITDPKKLATAKKIAEISDAVAPEYTNYLLRLAEYEGGLEATTTNTKNKNGSIDRGVFQINDKAFPQITPEMAHDIKFATLWAISLIQAGKQHKWVADQYIRNKVKLTIQ